MSGLGKGRPERQAGEAGQSSGGPNRRLNLAGPGGGDPGTPWRGQRTSGELEPGSDVGWGGGVAIE